MAKTVNNNIRLGLFVILAIVAFSYSLYRISNKADLFSGSIYITATFNDVRGLQPGNNVRFAGINIGSVEGVILDGDTMVKVTMKVVDEVATYMRKDAIAEIGTNGLVGNMLVNIMPGQGQAPYVQDGDMITSLHDGWAGQMMGNLSATSSDLSDLTLSLNQIAQKINHGSGTLSLLLNDETMAKDLQRMVRELQNASLEFGNATRQATQLIDGLKEGDGLVGRLVGDTATSGRFDRIMASLDDLVTSDAPQLMDDLKHSAGDLSMTSSHLKEVVDNLDKEGLTGAILGDPEKAEQLQNIMKNLEEGTDKFNLSMSALNNHWLLRRAVKRAEKEGLE